MKRTLVAIALALALASVSMTTNGAIADDRRPQLDVPYGDLNLAKPEGAKVMLQRIAGAAELVCGGRPSIRDMHERSVFRRCVRVTVADAVGQLRAPLVTALHEGRDPVDPRLADVWLQGSR
jgi:UrcA family protein